MQMENKSKISTNRIYFFTVAGLIIYILLFVGLVQTSQKQFPILTMILWGAFGGIFVAVMIFISFQFVNKMGDKGK